MTTKQVSKSETGRHGADKTTTYKWTTIDEPGDFRLINKRDLKTDATYQREATVSKVQQITQDWSWVACGVLSVAARDGDLWVIDGQHRLLAALRRSDIQHLPCLVFKTSSAKEEAVGFVGANTLRRPISAIDRQRALVVSKDEVAVKVNDILTRLGLEVKKTANGPNEIQCIGWCMKKAKADAALFERVIRLVHGMASAEGAMIPVKLLSALWAIGERDQSLLDDPRFLSRVKAKGVSALVNAAGRAAAYHNYGNEKVWSEGVLDEVNKGLQRRFLEDKAA